MAQHQNEREFDYKVHLESPRPEVVRESKKNNRDGGRKVKK